MQNLTKAEKRNLKQEENLREKCEVLLALVNSTQEIYNRNINVAQKNYLETAIGAAIWYLPKVDGLWDGCISYEALESFNSATKKTTKKLSEEHKFPRKFTARQLLSGEWLGSEYTNDVKGLMKYYVDVAGKYTYVTPVQNKQMIKFQKADEFISPEKAYKAAKIKFVSGVSREEIGLIKKRHKKTIKNLFAKAGVP